MPRERRRKKKLILAFHFHLANAAGWRCGECRRQGLEQRRRCAWMGYEPGSKIVWAHGDVVRFACPKPEIAAESLAWLELYPVWQARKEAVVWARDVEAMILLDREWEKARDEQQHRK